MRDLVHTNKYILLSLAGSIFFFVLGGVVSAQSSCDEEVVWASIVPTCLSVDDTYRILFVTSDKRDAVSTDIGDYNDFVQNNAAGAVGNPFDSITFRVLGSTATVDARDNTGTNPIDDGPGEPIFYYKSEKVADDYADLYDGDWDSTLSTNTEGYLSPGSVATGSTSEGVGASADEVELGGLDGAVQLGSTDSVSGTLSHSQGDGLSRPYSFYALSQPLTVPASVMPVAPEIRYVLDPNFPDAEVSQGITYLNEGDTVSIVFEFSDTIDTPPQVQFKNMTVNIGGSIEILKFDEGRKYLTTWTVPATVNVPAGNLRYEITNEDELVNGAGVPLPPQPPQTIADTVVDNQSPVTTFPNIPAVDLAVDTDLEITLSDSAIYRADAITSRHTVYTDTDIHSIVTLTKDDDLSATDLAVEGTTTISGSAITISPAVDFDHEARYTLTVDPYDDVAGNSSIPATYAFTTAQQPLSVDSGVRYGLAAESDTGVLSTDSVTNPELLPIADQLVFNLPNLTGAEVIDSVSSAEERLIFTLNGSPIAVRYREDSTASRLTVVVEGTAVSSLADGTHTVRADLTDTHGSSFAVGPYTFTVDSQSPAFVGPTVLGTQQHADKHYISNLDAQGERIPLTVGIAGLTDAGPAALTSLFFTLFDGEPVAGVTTVADQQVSVPAFVDGEGKLTATATDAAGNSVTRTVVLVVDTAAPTVTTSEPIDVPGARTPNISFSVNHNQQIQEEFTVAFAGDDSDCSGLAPLTLTGFGTQTYTISLVGAETSYDACTLTLTDWVGNTSPSIRLSDFSTKSRSSVRSRGGGGGGGGGGSSLVAPTLLSFQREKEDDTPNSIEVNGVTSGEEEKPAVSASSGQQEENTAPAFTRDLAIGDKGEDVRHLQQFLNRNGYTVAQTGPGSPGSETDYYGPATARAVAAFQEANGLPPVGIFGPQTRVAANSLHTGGNIDLINSLLELLRHLQELLRALEGREQANDGFKVEDEQAQEQEETEEDESKEEEIVETEVETVVKPRRRYSFRGLISDTD